MLINEFKKLLSDCANNTKNVRGLSSEWVGTGLLQVPDEIAKEIGAVVLLLQEQIDKGLFCNKDEFIMIYNFQLAPVPNSKSWCSIDMVIRPISEIDDLKTCKGRAFQLAINGHTRDLYNNAFISKMALKMVMDMMKSEFDDEDEYEEEDEETPICYGNYQVYAQSKSSEPKPSELTLSEPKSSELTPSCSLNLAKRLMALEPKLTSADMSTGIVKGMNMNMGISKAMNMCTNGEIKVKHEKESAVSKFDNLAVDISSHHVGVPKMLTYSYSYNLQPAEIPSPSSAPTLSSFLMEGNPSSKFRMDNYPRACVAY